MRLIDADALLRHLNDMWLGSTPSDTDTEETAKERRAICLGIDDCIGAVRAFPNADEWISVNDRLPEQHDTIFAKLKGTDKWKKGLFEKQSEDVRVVIEYPDGYRRVHHSYLVDGVWACETLPPEGRKVLYWMENPEPPKEE